MVRIVRLTRSVEYDSQEKGVPLCYLRDLQDCSERLVMRISEDAKYFRQQSCDS